MEQEQYVSDTGRKHKHPPAPKRDVPRWECKNADVYEEMMNTSIVDVTAAFVELFGDRKAKEDREFMAMAIGYRVMIKEMEEDGAEIPDILYQRMEAASNADIPKMLELGIHYYQGGDGQMTDKKKEKRKTISALMLQTLTLKKVPKDEDIIAKVKKEFPDSAFDAKHLAWYKSQVRQGKMKGQDGKPHEIAQAAKPKKEKKPAKAAKKTKKAAKKKKKKKSS